MKMLFLGIFAVLLVLPLASAFGVGSPYLEKNVLVLQPGESKIMTFDMQNMVGTTDYVVDVTLNKGQEIVKLIDPSTTYTVKANTRDILVNLRISIPSNSTIGTQYPVIISFITKTSGDSGTVSLGTGVDKSFTVVVGEIREKPGMPVYAWIILAAAVIIIVLLMRKKKSEIKKRK